MINLELPQVGVYEYVPRKRIRWEQAALDVVREEIDEIARLFILMTASLVNKTNIIDEIQDGLSIQYSGLFYDISEHARSAMSSPQRKLRAMRMPISYCRSGVAVLLMPPKR